MIINISTHFKHLGKDGQATAILTFHYEGDPDTRDALETAIRSALAPQQVQPEVGAKPSRIGFDMDQGE